MNRDLLNVNLMSQDHELQQALQTVERSWARHKYSYNFTWLGIPIIQLPQDIIALQEIIWSTKPTLIIETGIAHGGSLLFSASMLKLIGNNGRVVGIDIDIRAKNRILLESHPLSQGITMIQGSSLDEEVLDQVRAIADSQRTMLILDSNHTHEHVLEELRMYTPFVTSGCYCCVMDTIVERIPSEVYDDRPWGQSSNPMTALKAFFAENDDFAADQSIDQKLGISMAPGGYLRRK